MVKFGPPGINYTIFKLRIFCKVALQYFWIESYFLDKTKLRKKERVKRQKHFEDPTKTCHSQPLSFPFFLRDLFHFFVSLPHFFTLFCFLFFPEIPKFVQRTFYLIYN